MLTFLIPARFRGQAIIVSALLFVAGVVWLGAQGLKSTETPNGIIDIQQAGTTPNASRIIGSWRDRFGASLTPVYNDLLIDDLLFIPAYTTGIGLLCLWARDVLSGNASKNGGISGVAHKAGTLLALSQIVTAVCDYTENQATRVMLRGPIADPWPQITTGFASAKVGLITIGLLFSILGLIIWLGSRIVTLVTRMRASA